MFSNPTTTIFGIAVLVLKIVAIIKPSLGPMLSELEDALLGGGLIAAADASKHKTGPALRSVLWVLGFVCLLMSVIGFAAPAHAQTVTVDLHKASLAWDWNKGPAPNDGDPTGFIARCGKQAGVYNVQTPINDPAARSVPIRSVVNGQGVWFCVVAATNRYGTSADSNQVSFDAGARPAGPDNARVQAQ